MLRPRGPLRELFLAADVGITGVNFAIAETGSISIVTNEGNGQVGLAWNAVAGAASYNVYRSPLSGGAADGPAKALSRSSVIVVPERGRYSTNAVPNGPPLKLTSSSFDRKIVNLSRWPTFIP